MSDLFGVEVPEVTGLHNLLTLACETASLVGDTGLFPKLRALLTMAAWNKDRSEGLERGEIERMMYYAKPEETDVTGDVEAFLTKNDADGNKVVNTSELEIAVQTRSSVGANGQKTRLFEFSILAALHHRASVGVGL